MSCRQAPTPSAHRWIWLPRASAESQGLSLFVKSTLVCIQGNCLLKSSLTPLKCHHNLMIRKQLRWLVAKQAQRMGAELADELDSLRRELEQQEASSQQQLALLEAQLAACSGRPGDEAALAASQAQIQVICQSLNFFFHRPAHVGVMQLLRPAG